MQGANVASTRQQSKVHHVFSLIRQERASAQVEALALLQQFIAQSGANQSPQAEAPVTVQLACGMVQAYGQAHLPGADTASEAAASLLGAGQCFAPLADFGDALVVTDSWPIRERRTWAQRLWTPSLAERLKAWQALAVSLPPDNAVSNPELGEITQQYDHLKAWQSGMAVKIGVFMTLFVIIGGIIVQYAEFIDATSATAGIPSRLLGLSPYLAATYWGAVGACAAALYRLNQNAATRALRLDEKQEYLLKPVLGGILGLLVTVLAPAMLNERIPDLQPRALSMMSMIAALCGLCEASFFRRVKAVTASVLGIEEKKDEAQRATEAGL